MDDNKQLEFPPLQSHDKRFEAAMVLLSILCVIVVLVIVLFTDLGNELPSHGLTTSPGSSGRGPASPGAGWPPSSRCSR